MDYWTLNQVGKISYKKDCFVTSRDNLFLLRKIKRMKQLLLLLVIITSFNVFAQKKINEGVLVMKQTMSSEDEMMKAQFAAIGEMSTTTYFKGMKSRAESSNPMTGDITVLIDQDAQEMLMLMDNPMGKMYGKTSIALTEEQLSKIVVKPFDETRTILGYECKRVDVTTKEQGVEMTISFFVTDAFEIPTQQTAMFGDKLKGLPMYFEMKMNQMGMDFVITTEVTDIRDEKVDDAKFDMTVPEGYKENNILLGKQ